MLLLALTTLMVACDPGEVVECEGLLPVEVAVACVPDAAAIERNQHDALQLALREINRDGGLYADSVFLPDEAWMPYVQYLAAAHTVIGEVTCDDLSPLLALEATPSIAMDELLLQLDSSATWTAVLLGGEFPTGNADVDQLMTTYGLQYSDTYDWGFGDFVLLRAEESLNLQPLIAMFNVIPGVLDAFSNTRVGDGPDIEFTAETDAALLEYSIGYGDCPSGCLERDIWSFRVYPNCTATYAGFRHEP